MIFSQNRFVYFLILHKLINGFIDVTIGANIIKTYNCHIIIRKFLLIVIQNLGEFYVLYPFC